MPGNTLTLNAATFDTAAPKFGSACLSGGSGTITVGSILPSNGIYTAECWVKTTDTAVTAVALGATSWLWLGKSSANAGATSGPVSDSHGLVSTTNIADGAWHHLAFVSTGLGATALLFVDGVQVASTTSDAAPGSTSDTLGVGAYTNAGIPYPWTFGAIDEAAIWNTPKYSSNFTPPTAPYTGSETGLVALWHLDSNGTDSSGAVAATAITLTPATATTITTGTPAGFTVGLNGTLASGLTLTVALASTIGTLSAATLTFTGTGAQPAAQNFTLSGSAPGTGTLSLTHSEAGGTQSLADPASVAITVVNAPLSIGTLSVTSLQASVSLSLSAALAGGSGAGYQYQIYRTTSPGDSLIVGDLLATVGSLPWTDTTGATATDYFYAVQGIDSASTTTIATPAGLGTTGIAGVLWTPARRMAPAPINLVFIGDSITYGYLSTFPSATYCVRNLQRVAGTGAVYFSNQGVSGTTAANWAPGGGDYTGAVLASNSGSAASLLHTANPAAQVVFSIMLGTNDADNLVATATYYANMKAIVDQILTVDWPTAKVFLQPPPWMGPNTTASGNATVAMAQSYAGQLATLVASYATSHPGQVFMGDATSFLALAVDYQNTMAAQTGAPTGTVYLHPNDYGSAMLGRFWADSIAEGLGWVSAGAAAAPRFWGGFRLGGRA